LKEEDGEEEEGEEGEEDGEDGDWEERQDGDGDAVDEEKGEGGEGRRVAWWEEGDRDEGGGEKGDVLRVKGGGHSLDSGDPLPISSAPPPRNALARTPPPGQVAKSRSASRKREPKAMSAFCRATEGCGSR
jgi:hypothetical protein